MKVLVACEFSGIVRDAFIETGHDAMSCDLLPTESPGPHHQGDVREVLNEGWDMMVAHPPCTYLANSGVRWLYEKEDRWQDLIEGACFFRELLTADIPRIAVENPVMHKWARKIVGRGHDFTVQPWQFGHGETKRICWWTKNLTELEPTDVVDGRDARVHREPPSEDRWKERSRFYEGVAEAMADQWGSNITPEGGGMWNVDADTRAKEAHNNPEDCDNCGGLGRIPPRSDRPFPGGVTDMLDCPACEGSGVAADLRTGREGLPEDVLTWAWSEAMGAFYASHTTTSGPEGRSHHYDEDALRRWRAISETLGGWHERDFWRRIDLAEGLEREDVSGTGREERDDG